MISATDGGSRSSGAGRGGSRRVASKEARSAGLQLWAGASGFRGGQSVGIAIRIGSAKRSARAPAALVRRIRLKRSDLRQQNDPIETDQGFQEPPHRAQEFETLNIPNWPEVMLTAPLAQSLPAVEDSCP